MTSSQANSGLIRNRDRRRALELLASCRDGCTEALLRAHGFTVDMLAKIVLAGLASVSTERVLAGRSR